MRYCPRCGNEVPDDARFCGQCGHALDPSAPEPPDAGPQDAGSQDAGPRNAGAQDAGATLATQDQVLIFCGNICLTPVLGLVLYFVWKDEKPAKSQQACHLTIASLIVWLVLVILTIFLSVLGELS